MKAYKLNIRTVLAGIALLLLTANVYSQKSYKQSDFSNILASIKDRVVFVPVQDVPELNIILADNLTNLNYEEEIKLEKWMFNNNYYSQYLLCNGDRCRWTSYICSSGISGRRFVFDKLVCR